MGLGIIYDFTLYFEEGTCKTYGLVISLDIVLFLSSNWPVNQIFKLSFNNWFMPIGLIIALKEKLILAYIRSNRFKNCSLISEKDLHYRGRGSSYLKKRKTNYSCRQKKRSSIITPFDKECIPIITISFYEL